jgi:hypothetical protein
MGRLRWSVGSALLMVLGADSIGAEPVGASARFGVAEKLATDSACVTLSGPAIPTGTRVMIVVSDPPEIVHGRILGRRHRSCDERSMLDGTPYEVGLPKKMAWEGGWGIVVLAPGARGRVVQGRAEIRTSRSSTPLTFRECASYEGIHLTAWRGSRREWHEYVYVGIDLEANCSDEEFGD